jgi:diguanylate cyclase (GGDEF)-like protein
MVSLIPTRRLLLRLPPGRVQRSWFLLMGLTVLFVIGYAVYGVFFLRRVEQGIDLIVPVIFFSGAIFVLLASTLSLQTVVDVRRVTMLEQESVTDPLTGIFNRRYMDRRLQEEFARAKDYNMPFSILLLDVDHFKELNDFYGHQGGDQILVSLTRLILNSTRANDVVARYGGDEFMVIASNTHASNASQLSERIRQAIQSRQFEVTGESFEHVTVHLTISVGVSSYYEGVESIQSLIQCADQAMYQAKREGRNRTVVNQKCVSDEGRDRLAQEITETTNGDRSTR